MSEESQYLPKYKGGNKSRNGKPRTARALTPEQGQAIIWKVEDKWNNAQIARGLADDSRFTAVTTMTVGRWWGTKQVKRELKRQQERYNEELMPALILEANDLRNKGMKELDKRITEPSTRTGEVTNVVKMANEMIDRHKSEVIEEDENSQAKANLDSVWERLTPEARKKLAESYAFGGDVEIGLEDIQEAEVVEDERKELDSTTGIHQETST